MKGRNKGPGARAGHFPSFFSLFYNAKKSFFQQDPLLLKPAPLPPVRKWQTDLPETHTAGTTPPQWSTFWLAEERPRPAICRDLPKNYTRTPSAFGFSEHYRGGLTVYMLVGRTIPRGVASKKTKKSPSKFFLFLFSIEIN